LAQEFGDAEKWPKYEDQTPEEAGAAYKQYVRLNETLLKQSSAEKGELWNVNSHEALPREIPMPQL
jgi:hypothetical protein